ncbi:MAG: carboxypeptidase regulatory-like domain-containing protein [Polyangiaceae bacterium]|nr:carboxypeptidase regulatory-like domain-containing protein [Polyangiaceae bacterium]
MRARPFLVIGLLAAAIVGWALWVRSGKAPADGPAPPVSAAPTPGAPRLRAGAARPPAHASIAGRVADPAGAPVAGAMVCAAAGAGQGPFDDGDPTCAPSAQDGRYQIQGLSPARFTLFASAPGYRPAGYVSPDPGRARFLDLRAGEARAGVDFTLPRGGVEVRGQVKDVGGGVIAGALVRLNGWMGQGLGAAVTRSDAQGSFSAWIEEGPFIARAAADGYAEGLQHGAAPGPPVDIVLTPGSVLAGRVVEAGTGAPVAGARIDPGAEPMWGPFRSDAPQSDEEGRFRVTGLGPGRYKPSARVPGGFGQARESVLLGVGETSGEVVIALHPAPDVAGRVEVAPGGGPCPSGFVGLMGSTAGGVLQAVLDPDGGARFEGILPGSYEVIVSCPDHVPEPAYPPVEVKGAGVAGLVWTVRAGLSIRGRVVDREDRPVRAAVHAAPAAGLPRRPGAFTQSEEDGSFVLRGLAAGKHMVMASARDHVMPEPVEVDLLDERAPEVTIVVDGGGTIEGTVADEDRRPIAGAEIMVMGQGPGGWGPPVRTLADGSFAQKGVAPGEYHVWAMKGGTPLAALGQTGDGAPGVPVTVKAGTTARVQIVVERRGGEISGRVVDDGGNPVADGFIDAVLEQGAAGAPGGGPMLRRPMGAWSSTPVLTDPEGEFVVGDLSQGAYTVHAYRRGGGSGLVEHVKVGAAVTITIQRTASISGTLSAPGGAPPEHFRIRLANPAAALFREESFLFTGGAWAIRDVPEGKYEISADAPEGTATAEITLAAGEQRGDVALRLSARVAVTGQVVSLEDGAPLAGVRVLAFPRRGMAPPTPSMEDHVTDPAGHFEISRVPAGLLMVVAAPADPRDSDRDPAQMQLDVQPGAVTDLGRIPMAKRRLKPGELPGDLGFSLKDSMPYAAPGARSLEVGAVRPDGPAAAAALQAGDLIVSVDGYDVTGKMGYLYGTLTMVPEGTRVTLGVARGASVPIVAAKMPAAPDTPPPGMPPSVPPVPPPPP